MEGIKDACELDQYINLFCLKSIHGLSRKVDNKINILFSLLDNICPMGDDNLKILYFPMFSEKPICNFGIKKTKDNCCWYRFESMQSDSCRKISLNFKTILNNYGEINQECFLENYYLVLINFLICKIKYCLWLIKQGKYNDYVQDNLPYENRFGVIKRDDYWKIYPNKKLVLLNSLSSSEISKFICDKGVMPDFRLSRMTSRKYFKCFKKACQSIGYDVSNMSAKAVYLRYTCGDDEGLSEIDLDSPMDFDRWYDSLDRYGGHPYNLMKGPCYSRVSLYVEKDVYGYYFGLNGRNILKNVEIVKVYLGLKDIVPIYVYNYKQLKDSLVGSDYIGVVPRGLDLEKNSIYF